jgi:hypothetical protein
MCIGIRGVALPQWVGIIKRKTKMPLGSMQLESLVTGK